MMLKCFLLFGLINYAAAQKGGLKITTVAPQDGSSYAIQLMNSYVTAIKNKNIKDIILSDFKLTANSILDYNHFIDIINNIEIATIPTYNFTILPNPVKRGEKLEFSVKIDDFYTVNFTAVLRENKFQITSESGSGNPYNVPYLLNMVQLAELIAAKMIEKYEKFEGISEPYTLIYCDKTEENITRDMFLNREKPRKINIIDRNFAKINYITYLPNGEISFLYTVSQNISKVMRGKKLAGGKHVLYSEQIMLTCESEGLKNEYWDTMKNWALKFANYNSEQLVDLIEEDFEFKNLENQTIYKTEFIDVFLKNNRSMKYGSYYLPFYHLNDFVLHFQELHTLKDYEMKVNTGNDDGGKLWRMKQLANPKKTDYIKKSDCVLKL